METLRGNMFLFQLILDNRKIKIFNYYTPFEQLFCGGDLKS